MNLNAFILNQVLSRLDIGRSALKNFELASALSSVDGKGFPKELLALSLPMIARGLHNFTQLQMKRDWIYPYWVHRQLDPKDVSFIPRAQNPLLLNLTHRNWTLVGTPRGRHEAIVDPRGLVTPLPREWSVDSWLSVDGDVFFPSTADAAEQRVDDNAPRVQTAFSGDNWKLETEAFATRIRRGIDVVFCRATFMNTGRRAVPIILAFGVRPFNPEGIAPIGRIEIRANRLVFVDGTVGIVFAEPPRWTAFGSAKSGDSASRFGAPLRDPAGSSVACDEGLASGWFGYEALVGPGEQYAQHYSIALMSDEQLRREPLKNTWRVSYATRREQHERVWKEQVAEGMNLRLPGKDLQEFFSSSRFALLALHDDDFVSPGPYLYHHFWFRDAAPILRALDVLGYHARVRASLNAYPERLTREGFFRGPDGEWDSNGAALWMMHQHFTLTHSVPWLRRSYASVARAARWITRKRKSKADDPSLAPGLMPPSLSAEHLGMVDQYYWDTFWSLAGLRSARDLAAELQNESDRSLFAADAEAFEADIASSFQRVLERTGEALIPATPRRDFDESAIGSISCVYPLRLFAPDNQFASRTVRALIGRYVDDKGFFHPVIHSGYNVYLTLQLAHACLLQGRAEAAWDVAETILRNARPPYSFPEAIHPVTGGGAMGDGHHGWAAAEFILFLRSCLLQERAAELHLLPGLTARVLTPENEIAITNAPTTFGTVSLELRRESKQRTLANLKTKFAGDRRPGAMILHLPWEIVRAVALGRGEVRAVNAAGGSSSVELSADVTAVVLEHQGEPRGASVPAWP